MSKLLFKLAVVLGCFAIAFVAFSTNAEAAPGDGPAIITCTGDLSVCMIRPDGTKVMGEFKMIIPGEIQP
ncbi:MAG: hypothetical protein Q4E60_09350 [Bacteroidales bacterium]|nr:hypothetical protein [Bacteroidales bacterium]